MTCPLVEPEAISSGTLVTYVKGAPVPIFAVFDDVGANRVDDLAPRIRIHRYPARFEMFSADGHTERDSSPIIRLVDGEDIAVGPSGHGNHGEDPRDSAASQLVRDSERYASAVPKRVVLLSQAQGT
jgi:hypothetical protein